jgi:peptidoglycan/LPS O-acetylase OafA/YrhL
VETISFGYEAPKIPYRKVATGAYIQLIVVLASSDGLSLLLWRFIEVPAGSGRARSLAE